MAHTVSVAKLRAWLSGGGKSPNELATKKRLRGVLGVVSSCSLGAGVILTLMARRKQGFGSLSMSDAELMAAALFGLEHRRSAIDEQIAELRRVVRKTDFSKTAVPTRKKHTMSAAARQRIAAAQRKRWAAVRKAKKAAGE